MHAQSQEYPASLVVMKCRPVIDLISHFLSNWAASWRGLQGPARLGPCWLPQAHPEPSSHAPFCPSPLGPLSTWSLHTCSLSLEHSLPSPGWLLLWFSPYLSLPQGNHRQPWHAPFFCNYNIFHGKKYLSPGTIQCWEETALGPFPPHIQQHFPEPTSFHSPFIKQVCQAPF